MDFNQRKNYGDFMKPKIPPGNWDRFMFSNRQGKWMAPQKIKRNHQNESNVTAIAGNWIAAIGTILSAIGSTPSTTFSEQTLEDFNIIGNILEAGGSAIVSDTEDAILNRVGGQISAIGNVLVVAGILSKNEQFGQRLEKQGDLLQVVGVGITINTEGRLTLTETIANIGNIIQFIGNTIEVLADTDTKEGVVASAAGAWIQAVGAVITALQIE